MNHGGTEHTEVTIFSFAPIMSGQTKAISPVGQRPVLFCEAVPSLPALLNFPKGTLFKSACSGTVYKARGRSTKFENFRPARLSFG